MERTLTEDTIKSLIAGLTYRQVHVLHTNTQRSMGLAGLQGPDQKALNAKATWLVEHGLSENWNEALAGLIMRVRYRTGELMQDLHRTDVGSGSARNTVYEAVEHGVSAIEASEALTDDQYRTLTAPWFALMGQVSPELPENPSMFDYVLYRFQKITTAEVVALSVVTTRADLRSDQQKTPRELELDRQVEEAKTQLPITIQAKQYHAVKDELSKATWRSNVKIDNYVMVHQLFKLLELKHFGLVSDEQFAHAIAPWAAVLGPFWETSTTVYPNDQPMNDLYC